MFIFRHSGVSWGHGQKWVCALCYLRRRVFDSAGGAVAAAGNTSGSVFITPWGWLSCNNKELGLFIKKRCLFCYCDFVIKVVGERRGEDVRLIVGVAAEVVHHYRDVCTIRFNS